MSDLVTIVVSPRERFRPLPASLRSLFQTIDPGVPVIVVDGGAPEHIRAEVRALRDDRPFELIETDGFVLPNKARNLGFDKVDTKYVAFCDNDIEYSQGWLEALVRNAEENGAVAVAPLTLIGPFTPKRIHHAGGTMVLDHKDDGTTSLGEYHTLANVDLPEAEANGFKDAPLDHDHFEYHCTLVNAAALRAIGGHDERLIRHEHLDSSMRLLMNGGRITFEKDSEVMYRAVERFTDEDWPYFLYRWSIARSVQSDTIMNEAWGLAYDADPDGGWVLFHQNRAINTLLPRLPKPLNRGRIRHALLKYYRRRVLRLDPALPDDPAPHIPPLPPSDGLARVGERLAR